MAQNTPTAFEAAFQEFCDELVKNPKRKKKLEFVNRIKVANGTLTPKDVQNSVENLVGGASDRSLRRLYSKFGPIVDAMRDYTGIIDTMVQAYPFPTALIWGGLRILIECAGRYSKTFDSIKNQVQSLPDILWDLSSFEHLYGTSPYGSDVVRRLLGATYMTILKFFYRCTETLEHPVVAALKENRKLQSLLDSLQENWDHLNKIRAGVEAQLSQDTRKQLSTMERAVADEHVKAAIDRSAAAIERLEAKEERRQAEIERAEAKKERELAAIDRKGAEEERRLMEEERMAQHAHREQDAHWKMAEALKALVNRLENKMYNTFNWGIYNGACDERHRGTCEWLYGHEAFEQWVSDEPHQPVLWLHGKHGAGKSVLCASAIERVIPATDQVLPPTVAFQFLTKDHYIPKNQLLRNIAAQLLFPLTVNPETIPTSMEPFLQLNADDSRAVEALIHALLIEIPLTYIFVDGLDEAEYTDDEASTLQSSHRNLDVPSFVEFLIREVQHQPTKVRLWCSSQPLPHIRDFMCKPEWDHNLRELCLTTDHTATDILHYLQSAIPESTGDKGRFAQLFATAALTSEVEGSFLWAKLMLNDLKDRAEDTDDLINLAKEGLPNRIEKLYCKIIKRIQERDGGGKELPLWKIILSLVTFAKRPLRIVEIIEAIAIIRTREGYNLNDSRRVRPAKILDSCMSLVRHISDEGGDLSNAVLRLSHSAVRTFLLKNSAVDCSAADEDKPLVTSRIIRDSCLLYLSQPRYKSLLTRNNLAVGGFRTLTGEGVGAHRFLSYTAKYWYQHFDSPTPSISPSLQDVDDTVRFLRSPNFQTCMQVQSLFVIGHFLQRFDPITDQANLLRRTLPNWMARLAPEIYDRYTNFQCEWCHLLQSGQSQEFGGQIDRCFWRALGPANFLSPNNSRYQSFEFAPPGSGGNACMIQKLSPDGRAMMTCSIGSQGDTVTAQLTKWSIDGISTPTVEQQASVQFSATDTNIRRYWLPCSTTVRSLPLVPNVECAIPPVAMCLSPDYSAIRLGSKILQNTPDKDQGPVFTQSANESLGDSWEDVCTRGEYIIVSRRRIPRRQPPTVDEKEQRRIQLMKDRINDRAKRSLEHSRLRAARRQKFVEEITSGNYSLTNSSSELGSTPSDSDSDSNVDPDSVSESDTDPEASTPASERSSDSEGDLELSAAEESWSEASTATEGMSSDDLDESDADNSEDELELSTESDEEESKTASSLSIHSHLAEDSSDSESVSSCVSMSRFIDDSSEESDGYISEGDVSEDEAFNAVLPPTNLEPVYPVTIASAPRRYNIMCDGCQKGPFRQYLHCTICCDNNFDLCLWCEKRGRWCFDQSHQLDRRANGQNIGVLLRRNFRIRQELAVYRREGDQKSPVFHTRRKYDSLLYQSPPVVHPEHSLVVWALSGSSLLFADFKANQFFEQKLKVRTANAKKARPICVNMSFSTCGRYLRVACIDATAERYQNAPSPGARRICLNLHVLILQLSASKPTKVPPKLASTMTIRLGQCLRPLVQQLPFAFTWAAEDLYLTISDSRLRVYRVTMPQQPQQADAHRDSPSAEVPHGTFSVTTPKETIFLPRSARNRSVQFFPPREEAWAKSTVIIGPRYGRNPTPPIGVYLSQEDLGEWAPVREGGVGDRLSYTPQMVLEGLMEEFDEEADCDLIPIDC